VDPYGVPAGSAHPEVNIEPTGRPCPEAGCGKVQEKEEFVVVVATEKPHTPASQVVLEQVVHKPVNEQTIASGSPGG